MTLNKTDRIVITLGKQIVHGKYVPGSPLPAEAELCEEFATSRNIIREVFRSLMAKRLIEMKRYRGAFVAPRNQWNYLDTDVRHCCKVSDEAAFCLIQRPYISKTLLTRRISPRGSP